jgi:uridine kinase
MVPSTGYLKLFDLKFNEPGLVLRFPEKSTPNQLPEYKEQKKLFNIFREFENWGKILELENISHLNDAIKGGRISEVMAVAEGLHEKKIAQIADMISASNNKKLVLIAGPSSSGKTTFAQRLSVQLRVNGLKPVPISLDDFFKNREDTPKDEFGEYDFETIDSIDIVTFNDVIKRLIEGEEVEMPSFNFHTGDREWKGKKLRITEEQVLVVEGIHGLNERLTQYIPKEQKFKIYISALTHLSIDDHNRIPTSDLRLIRRIVRDFQFRSADALSTIKRWDSVRRGEDTYIYPFQEEADIMFNSSLVYELAVLNQIALPQLEKIDNSVPEYIEAKRLSKFLQYFLNADIDEIPSNSILREFVGKSCFFEKE